MNISALTQSVDAFALQIMETLADILPSGNLGLNVRVSPVNDQLAYAVVSPAEELGLAICVDSRVVMRLIPEYRLSLSPVSTFLSVERSTFKVYLEGVRAPLFTQDYIRDSHNNVPAAHINVHAKREDTTTAMMSAGQKRRGKIYSKRVQAGKLPQFGELHFPVGGHRFRPCLEDVLEMLMIEFGIDVHPHAGDSLREGRRRWREFQLAAAVSDDPSTAVEELRRLGYEVSWPGGRAEPVARMDRLTAH